MRVYIIKRLLLTVPVVLGVTVLVFLFIHLIPGDPVEVMLGESAANADREALRHALHLDRPLYVQFGYFLKDLSTGELESIFYHEPVMRKVFARLGATFQLALLAMCVSILIAIPMGIIAAVKRDSIIDIGAMTFSMAGVCMPNFWIGPMLVMFFSIKLMWFPVSGKGGIEHMVLPAITLGFGMAAILSRMTRGSLLEVIGEDYLTVARAKGLAEKWVILKHALKNALIPIITVIGLQFGALLAGSIITETIFAWPGIGRLLIESIQTRDFPLVQGCVLVIALTYVMVNLVTDILYAVADPRVRFEEGR